jgi:hypothetical protein
VKAIDSDWARWDTLVKGARFLDFCRPVIGSLVAELCAMICLDVSSEIYLLLGECDRDSLDASDRDLLDAIDRDSLDASDHDSLDGGGGILYFL